MKQDTIDRINDFFDKNPIAKGQSSSQEEVSNAEKELGLKFDADYVFFLLNYGGSMIKANEIYGLTNSELMGDDNIIELTKSYRQTESSNMGWLIIGSDYSGNSIGINEDGKVLLFDHDLDELIVLGDSFEDYVAKSLN